MDIEDVLLAGRLVNTLSVVRLVSLGVGFAEWDIFLNFSLEMVCSDDLKK